jgi:hypothetical protein
MTGLDRPVIDYIERAPESEAFWLNVRGIVDRQIREYRRRGFTSLTVNFGCTGGQHRSVYFAERLRRHILDAHEDVHPMLMHREEPYWPQEASGGEPGSRRRAGSPASEADWGTGGRGGPGESTSTSDGASRSASATQPSSSPTT